MAIRIDSRVLDRRIKRLTDAIDGQKLLAAVATGQVAWIDRNFREGGSERRWPPLSPRTVYARRRGSSAPLQDTGRLKQSFFKRIGQRSATVTTNSQIADIHHEGTGPFEIRPVRRKFLTIPDPGGPATFRKGKLSGKRGYFSKGVRHPGIPARPLLPSKALAESMAEKTIVALLKKNAG